MKNVAVLTAPINSRMVGHSEVEGPEKSAGGHCGCLCTLSDFKLSDYRIMNGKECAENYRGESDDF
jgi:hypothetical protein